MTLLAADSLSVRIGALPICTALDLQLHAGEFWAVLGGNGVGKTTLLHTLAGLRAPHDGGVAVDGVALGDWNRKKLAQRVGILFQDNHDFFPSSVLETVLTGRYPHEPFWSVFGSGDVEAARRALDAVELGGMAHRQVDTLSGGERRRLAIAALLVQDPHIWLLDEPSNHLDLRHQIGLLSLLCNRAREKHGALVMTLHDVNLATRFCTHAALMVDHRDILLGPVDEVINTGNLARLYGHPVRCVEGEDGAKFYCAG